MSTQLYHSLDIEKNDDVNDSHYLSGWWIMPAILISLTAISGTLYLLAVLS